jgi:site-specific recombinase XerD
VIIRRGNHTQAKETGETSVNDQSSSEQNIGQRTPSGIEAVDKDKPQPIRDWQQRYERYLFLTGRKATQERYARALERFLGNYPSKTYPHQFLRATINEYVETRLGERASAATVRVELSAIRGLFQFMLDMGASDVMFNPAKGVKVKTRKPAPVAQTVEQ